MDMQKEKKISDIILTFNSQVSKLMKVMEAMAPNHSKINWFKRVSKIARDEIPNILIAESKDKIWDNLISR